MSPEPSYKRNNQPMPEITEQGGSSPISLSWLKEYFEQEKSFYNSAAEEEEARERDTKFEEAAIHGSFPEEDEIRQDREIESRLKIYMHECIRKLVFWKNIMVYKDSHEDSSKQYYDRALAILNGLRNCIPQLFRKRMAEHFMGIGSESVEAWHHQLLESPLYDHHVGEEIIVRVLSGSDAVANINISNIGEVFKVPEESKLRLVEYTLERMLEEEKHTTFRKPSFFSHLDQLSDFLGRPFKEVVRDHPKIQHWIRRKVDWDVEQGSFLEFLDADPEWVTDDDRKRIVDLHQPKLEAYGVSMLLDRNHYPLSEPKNQQLDTFIREALGSEGIDDLKKRIQEARRAGCQEDEIENFLHYRTEGFQPATILVIQSKFREFSELEYADNFRLARANNPDEVAKYKAAQNDGCCGSQDETLETADGTIMIGCNYGH